MKIRHYIFGRAFLAIIVAGVVYPAESRAQSGAQPITQEYFVQQEADEALLIKINSFEAEFTSKLTAQGGEVLMLSGIPGNRMTPLFQFVHASRNTRQLEIEVRSELHTDRSQFGIELVRMPEWDERSRFVSRAYQLISLGMQVSKGKSRADWTVRIDSLLNAGRLFQRFGMQEMRLWSNYLAAYLVQTHLHDYSIVYSMTREILADLKGSRLQKVEMAALQLQAAALIGLNRSGVQGKSEGSPDSTQTALSNAAAFAESNGFEYELAYALNLSGVEYMSQSMYSRALEQFQSAVQVADRVGDAELATGIRESIVEIHAMQGDVPASGEVLRQIETQLLDGGDGDELALNLLAQGRLLIRSYRYHRAADTLYQALDHENNSAIRKQINFELAKIFYETGRLDESIAYLKLAEVDPRGNRPQRANSIVDIGQGLQIMASIHRSRGEYDSMRIARAAQGRFDPPAARYFYDQGLDTLALPARDHHRARSFFRQSHQAAIQSGHVDLQHLSRLQFCAAGKTRGADQDLCTDAAISDSYQHLINGGVPRFATEAMNLRVQLLVLDGQNAQAIATMDRLLDEIHLYRYSLPGVLGAWYEERHEYLFNTCLDLLIGSSGRNDRADGAASLLALSKIRRIEKYAGTPPISATGTGDTELLRRQLDQRANMGSGQTMSTLNMEIARALAAHRALFNEEFEYLSSKGLQQFLQSLSRDERVLTYHISPTLARVWVAQRGKVQTQAISNPAYIYSALQEARQGLADIGQSSFNSKMDALGARMLGPVADLLKKTIYWVPAGALMGFPLDALRLKGRYLLEDHSVVGLMSFPAKVDPSERLKAGSMDNVFLAGHPQDYSSDYANRLETSAEISALADIFVGPGLQIIQGVALLPDEFEDEKFRNADLVHFSMPGIINLRSPDQSSLELSAGEYAPGRVAYRPLDIRTQRLAAKLVFLSSTTMKDEPPSAFGKQAGLVSDLIDVGAQSVIASLWSSSGPATEALIKNFYLELVDSGDIINALKKAKGQYIKDNHESGLYDWVSFQLYIN